MKNKKIKIFLVIYLLLGCLTTLVTGGNFVKKSMYHGYVYQYWIKTDEAYLNDTYLYIKGTKKTTQFKKDYSDIRTANIYNMFIKYDLSMKFDTLKKYPIYEISEEEFINNRNESTLFDVVSYDDYNKCITMNIGCKPDIYDKDYKYIFVDGDISAMQKKEIHTPYTSYNLDDRIRPSRSNWETCVFILKFIISLFLDSLVWPIYFLLLSPTAFMGSR